MRIVVCVKEVVDPDAVNALALGGHLSLPPGAREVSHPAICRLINGYDEQAVEAALRLRDRGLECTIVAISVGENPLPVLRHALALGADEMVHVPAVGLEPLAVARVLAAYVRRTGADLVLCGRQASDDDQAVVPPALAELLSWPVVTQARAVEIECSPQGAQARVTQVTPEGDWMWEVPLPAVISVSNELGQPRYPTAARSIRARRMSPQVVTVQELGLGPQELAPLTALESLAVAQVQGECQFIEGSTAEEKARLLVQKLAQEGLIST